MQKNKIKHLIFILICVLVATVLYSIPYNLLTTFENNMVITKQEISNLSLKNLSFLLKSEVIRVSAVNDENDKTIN